MLLRIRTQAGQLQIISKIIAKPGGVSMPVFFNTGRYVDCIKRTTTNPPLSNLGSYIHMVPCHLPAVEIITGLRIQSSS